MSFPDTTFTTGTTITSNWLNAVNDKVQEIISVKDFGAVGDGVTDDTAAFNQAVASAAATSAELYIPKANYLLATRWLITDDNPYGTCNGVTINIAAGTRIFGPLNPTDVGIIEIDGVSNVTINAYGAIVDGQIGSLAGWPSQGTTPLASAPVPRPMNLILGNFGGGSNITIRGLKLMDAAQDNIYIRSNPNNVRLIDVWCYGAGRNNLSIISASDFYAENCTFQSARQWFIGDFGYGVDCEPNAASEVLSNLVFDSCYALDNIQGGFYVLAANFDNTSTQNVQVRLLNCRESNSGWNTTTGVRTTNKAVGFSFYGPANTATITSRVEFIGCHSSTSNNYGFEIIRHANNVGSVTLQDIRVDDWNALGSSSPINVNAVAIKSLDSITQTLAVHISGAFNKNTNVSGEYIFSYGTGLETYDNVWLNGISVSGAVNPRTNGITGVTSSNMLGSASLTTGPKHSFSVMPSAVSVTGTGLQTIANNSVTKLTCFSGGTESGSGQYNFGRDFSLTNSEWTPKEPGLYMVFIKTKLATLVDNSRVYISLYQDPATGSFAEFARQESTIVGTASTNQNFVFCQPILVNATGYKYDVRLLQATGGNSDVLGASTNFMAVRVG